MVTGGLGDKEDSTEIFSDSVWRTVGKLPAQMVDMAVTTINNRMLLFGNLWFEIKYIKCISSGGNIYDLQLLGDTTSIDILEFNHETESWTVIGAMKEKRRRHGVSVVSSEDYEKWCN